MKNLRLRVTNGVQREICKFNLKIQKSIQVTLGIRSERMQGPKVWNSLLYYIKVAEILENFKSGIKLWDGKTCSSNTCSIYNEESFCRMIHFVYETDFNKNLFFLGGCRLLYIWSIVNN